MSLVEEVIMKIQVITILRRITAIIAEVLKKMKMMYCSRRVPTPRGKFWIFFLKIPGPEKSLWSWKLESPEN